MLVKTEFSLYPCSLYTNMLPYKCAQTDWDFGNVLAMAEFSLKPSSL